MNTLYIKNSTPKKNITINDIASDKSISHRSAIFSLLCDGKCVIENYLLGEDTLNTLSIVKSLGAKVEIDNSTIHITPPNKIQEPNNILECGNSGTAIRLIAGFLSGIDSGVFILNGDDSIRRRPMGRIMKPLRENGAHIIGRANNTLAPLVITGVKAKGFDYTMEVSSAQVKSAMILYALFADKPSVIKEEYLSRNHTEIMLNKMGVDLKSSPQNAGAIIQINPLKTKLKPFNMKVPADPSSGFFFALMACLIKDSKIVLKNILLNKTRIEAYKVLQSMGAKIQFITTEENIEDVGDIIIEYAPLNAITVDKNIAWLIDEIPALAIAFCIAKGNSKIINASELRHKESDRIKSVVDNLKLCNIDVKEFDDGFEVVGQDLNSFDKSENKIIVNSYKDHRIAMSFAVFSLVRNIEIVDIDCINTSFPNFIFLFKEIANEN